MNQEEGAPIKLTKIGEKAHEALISSMKKKEIMWISISVFSGIFVSNIFNKTVMSRFRTKPNQRILISSVVGIMAYVPLFFWSHQSIKKQYMRGRIEILKNKENYFPEDEDLIKKYIKVDL